MVRQRAQFSRAIPLEADGISSTGEATTAADIDRWRFVFDNQRTPRSRFRSVFVDYRNRRFGKVTGVRAAFVEDRHLKPLPRMTLAQAIGRLRGAGYEAPIVNVALRFPLDPSFTEPLYIFGLSAGSDAPFVGVGTKTGSVAPID